MENPVIGNGSQVVEFRMDNLVAENMPDGPGDLMRIYRSVREKLFPGWSLHQTAGRNRTGGFYQGKFKQVLPDILIGPLPEKDPVSPVDDEIVKIPVFLFIGSGPDRQFSDPVPCIGKAVLF
jgi:hypothetical protein